MAMSMGGFRIHYQAAGEIDFLEPAALTVKPLNRYGVQAEDGAPEAADETPRSGSFPPPPPFTVLREAFPFAPVGDPEVDRVKGELASAMRTARECRARAEAVVAELEGSLARMQKGPGPRLTLAEFAGLTPEALDYTPGTRETVEEFVKTMDDEDKESGYRTTRGIGKHIGKNIF